MRLQALISDLPGGRLLRGGDVDVTGLAIDSRKVQPGDLFVAIRGGQEADRHPYVPQAVAAGAVGVVVEEAVEAGGAAVVQAPSTRRALAVLADRFYGSPSCALKMVGVTGTNGKTTTVYLIQAIMEAAGWRPGLIGTVEYRLGTQRAASVNTTPEANDLHRMLRQMVEAECRAAVMEVASHGLALHRVYGIRFQTAVFTNLTRDHLDFHRTPEDYLAAKAMLFDNLDSDAYAVVNADDSASVAMLKRCRAKVIRYGAAEGADVRILDGRTDLKGTEMRLQTPAGPLDLRLSLRGRFNLWNAAAAAAACLTMGIAPATVAEGVRKVQVPGRFEAVDCGQDFGVFVDYAHAPGGLENVLKAARAFTKGRLICVFGCGGDRDRGKRPEMGRLSADLADLSVVTSDNPRTEDPEAIIREILPGIGQAPHQVEPDRRRAIELAIRSARSGDLVLIAGKGHEDYQIIGREKIHFDDREVAREALAQLKG